MMLPSALLLALVAHAQTAAPPPLEVRARSQVLVQIITAAEVRRGRTSSPHQRTVRTDNAGQTQILLEFE